MKVLDMSQNGNVIFLGTLFDNGAKWWSIRAGFQKAPKAHPNAHVISFRVLLRALQHDPKATVCEHLTNSCAAQSAAPDLQTGNPVLRFSRNHFHDTE